MLQFSDVFYKNLEAYKDPNIKYIINQGGTSSTKTYSTLQLLTAIIEKHRLHVDIVGLSVPHLKSGVLNDMIDIAPTFAINFDKSYNKSDKLLKLKGRLNFLAFDKLGKAHGGRRDILYMNEANHLNFKIAEQLMIRTRRKVFIDYNPTNAFWVHNKLLKEQPEKCRVIKSTYMDNPFLEQSIIDTIESKKGDGKNNFWRVYGLGELGIAEGLIFNNFEQKTFDKTRFSKYYNGLDWGFSNDPFAFVRMAVEQNNLYICDEIYQKGLLNKDSAPLVKAIIGDEKVICDSAEPKSVAEFRSLGVNAHSAKKGKGSIESGIKHMQSYDKIFIHPDCPNTYGEYCNYQWVKDNNGDDKSTPIDAFNHAIDGGRYGLEERMRYNSTKLIGGRPF